MKKIIAGMDKMRGTLLPFAISLLILICSCAAVPEPIAPTIKEFNLKAWQWGYSPNIITVNENDIVRLKLISLDVEHSLTCKELGIDISIPQKGSEPVVFEFQPKKRGDFIFYCNKQCGPANSSMKLRMIVMP